MKVNLRESNLKTLLNCLQYLLISLAANEGDRKTLGSETSSTTNTMEVRISITWEIVVDSQVDPLNIDTTTEDVGGDTDTLVELLELLVTLDTTLLLAIGSR